MRASQTAPQPDYALFATVVPSSMTYYSTVINEKQGVSEVSYLRCHSFFGCRRLVREPNLAYVSLMPQKCSFGAFDHPNIAFWRSLTKPLLQPSFVEAMLGRKR